MDKKHRHISSGIHTSPRTAKVAAGLFSSFLSANKDEAKRKAEIEREMEWSAEGEKNAREGKCLHGHGCLKELGCMTIANPDDPEGSLGMPAVIDCGKSK